MFKFKNVKKEIGGSEDENVIKNFIGMCFSIKCSGGVGFV